MIDKDDPKWKKYFTIPKGDHQRLETWIQMLGKWRMVFASWQLGSRSIDDPECRAVRDHHDRTMMLRAECSAFTRILLAKGVITQDEWEGTLAEECEELCKLFEGKFPGFKATNDGMKMTMPEAAVTMSKFPP